MGSSSVLTDSTSQSGFSHALPLHMHSVTSDSSLPLPSGTHTTSGPLRSFISQTTLALISSYLNQTSVTLTPISFVSQPACCSPLYAPIPSSSLPVISCSPLPQTLLVNVSLNQNLHSNSPLISVHLPHNPTLTPPLPVPMAYSCPPCLLSNFHTTYIYFSCSNSIISLAFHIFAYDTSTNTSFPSDSSPYASSCKSCLLCTDSGSSSSHSSSFFLSIINFLYSSNSSSSTTDTTVLYF